MATDAQQLLCKEQGHVIAASFLRHDSLHQVIQVISVLLSGFLAAWGEGDHTGATEVVLESGYGGGSYVSITNYVRTYSLQKIHVCV